MADDLVGNHNEVPTNVVPTTEELLCNSVKMIRENLKIYGQCFYNVTKLKYC